MKDETKQLLEKLKYYEESPYHNGYVACLVQIEMWADEMRKNPVKLSNAIDFDYAREMKEAGASMEEIVSADQKAFDKAHKFILSIDALYGKLEYLRLKMTPEDVILAKAEATSTIDEVRGKVKGEMNGSEGGR